MVQPSILELHPTVVILGPPGAGKGTLAARLEREVGFVHVDIGEVLRQRATWNDATADRIVIAQARGAMVAKEIVLSTLRERLTMLEPGAPILLDGFPRTATQVAAVDDGRVPLAIIAAINLRVSSAIATERIRIRQATRARADGDPSIVAARLAMTADTIDVVRNMYERRGILEHVDADDSPGAVYERVRSVLPIVTHA